MTPAEAKRLARMLLSPLTREELTDDEWRAIAANLVEHNRPAHAPLLEDRDPSAAPVLRAQHEVAWLVMDWQRRYRLKEKVERIPGSVTDQYLDEAIKRVATPKRLDPRQISEKAVRTIVRNQRVALRGILRWRPPPMLRPTK
jgi:hypothetical protein